MSKESRRRRGGGGGGGDAILSTLTLRNSLERMDGGR